MERKEVEVGYPDIVLFGPPCSGKGTQGQKIVEEYGYKKFEMSKIIQKAINEGTPAGEKASKYKGTKSLVPDEIIFEILEGAKDEIWGEEPILFDGFPRTEDQRILFEKMMKENGREFEVIALSAHTSEEIDILVQRGINRGLEAQKKGIEDIRQDDLDANIVRGRQEEYEKKTAAVLDGWKNKGRPIYEISAIGSIEEIREEIEKTIKRFAARVFNATEEPIIHEA